MSKHKIIGLLACLLAVGLLLTVKYHPRTVPIEECSQLYRDFADNPHVAVAFIKDFHVNDTLAVDVTTLQADSDSAWYELLLDFGASEELIDMYRSEKKIYLSEGCHSGIVFYIDINNPKQRMQYNEPDSRVVIGSPTMRSLCVFMTADTKFKEIIFYNELDKVIFHEQNS